MDPASIDKNILQKSAVSEKTAVPAQPDDGHLPSSINNSLQSVDSLVSLPDLLPPEAAYKKQIDTDTDTTEYESAAETDHSDAVTPCEQDVFNNLQEAVKYQLIEGETDLVCGNLDLDERDKCVTSANNSEVPEYFQDKTVEPEEDEKTKDSDLIYQCTDTELSLSKEKICSIADANVSRLGLIENTSSVVGELESSELPTKFDADKAINKLLLNTYRAIEAESSFTESSSFVSTDCEKSLVEDPSDSLSNLTVETPLKSSYAPLVAPINEVNLLSPSQLCEAFSKLSLQTPDKNKCTVSHLEVKKISFKDIVTPKDSFQNTSVQLTVQSPEQKKETEPKVNHNDINIEISPSELETLAPLEKVTYPLKENEINLEADHSPVINETVFLSNVDQTFAQLDVKSPESQNWDSSSDQGKACIQNTVSDAQYPLDEKSLKETGGSSLHQFYDDNAYLEEKSLVKVYETESENEIAILNKQDETFEQLNVKSVIKDDFISGVCDQAFSELDIKSDKKNVETESDLILDVAETTVNVSVPSDSVICANLCVNTEKDTAESGCILKVDNVLDTSPVQLVKSSEIVPAEQDLPDEHENKVESEPIEIFPSERDQSCNRLASKTVEKEIQTESVFILNDQISLVESVAKTIIKESCDNHLPIIADLTESTSKVEHADKSLVREQGEIHSSLEHSTTSIPSHADFAICESVQGLLEVDGKCGPHSVHGSDLTASYALEPLVNIKVPEKCIEIIPPSILVPTVLVETIVKKKEIQTKDIKILDELIEICNRQQKDLDQSEEEFRNKDSLTCESHVGAKDYSDNLCIASNLQPKIVSGFSDCKLQVSRSDVGIIHPCISEKSIDVEPHTFEDIALEANKLADSILEDSKGDINVENDGDSPTCVFVDTRMADSENIENLDNAGNPFVTQSSLRRTPPPSEKRSPRTPKSRGNSPLKTYSVGTVNTEVCEETNNMNSAEIGDPFKPKTKIHNSPTRDATSVGRGIVSNASNQSKESSGKKLPAQKIKSSESQKGSSINPEVNQSEAGPEIADGVHYQADDVFKDSATYDFLSSIGGPETVEVLRNQSLITKFDPLVKPISQTVKSASVAIHNESNKGDSGVAAAFVTYEDPRLPTGDEVHCEVLNLIDKLISVTPVCTESAKYKQTHLDKPTIQAVTKELFASDKQDIIPKPQEEIQSKNSNTDPEPEMAVLRAELNVLRKMMVQQKKSLEKERQEHGNEVVTLKAALSHFEELCHKTTRKLNEKIQGIEQMSLILEEYEKTISRLVAEKEQEKQNHEKEVKKVVKEKDTMQVHLENIEIAFSDVHQKYERSKQVIQGFKTNEEVLKASLTDYSTTLTKQEDKYDKLKAHAMSQLESANQELDSLRRSQQLEISKLKAMLKKSDVKITSLEESLEQKTKENSELVGICDELIGNVGAEK